MYNYERLSDYTSLVTEGLTPGSLFPSYGVITTAGQPITFGEQIRGPWVLETASLSCPAYARQVEAMQSIVERFPMVQFMVLYVREAYPSRRFGMHRSVVEKLDRAVSLSQLRHDNRSIFVDDLCGTVHLDLGGWPNMLYIVDASGRVVHRADWNDASTTAEVLNQLTRSETSPVYPPSPDRPFPGVAIPWLLQHVGVRAAWDHLRAIPSLLTLERQRRERIKQPNPAI